MDPSKLEAAKKELEAEREPLMKELEQHSRVQVLEDEAGSNVDPEVQADEAEEFANSLAIGDALRARINEIDRALNKINTGTYGVCVNCKKDISPEALKASPGREYCIDCQRSMNAQ
jgi:RNA polymerase-binding protein DksA